MNMYVGKDCLHGCWEKLWKSTEMISRVSKEQGTQSEPSRWQKTFQLPSHTRKTLLLSSAGSQTETVRTVEVFHFANGWICLPRTPIQRTAAQYAIRGWVCLAFQGLGSNYFVGTKIWPWSWSFPTDYSCSSGNAFLYKVYSTLSYSLKLLWSLSVHPSLSPCRGQEGGQEQERTVIRMCVPCSVINWLIDTGKEMSSITAALSGLSQFCSLIIMSRRRHKCWCFQTRRYGAWSMHTSSRIAKASCKMLVIPLNHGRVS
jgi:hypothetical protein